MRRTGLTLQVLFFWMLLQVQAQDTHRELFVGYSGLSRGGFARNISAVLSRPVQFASANRDYYHGLGVNFSQGGKHWGVFVDVAYAQGPLVILESSAIRTVPRRLNSKVLQTALGPKLTFRSKDITGFLHGSIGYVNGFGSETVLSFLHAHPSGLSWGGGGGLDVNLNDRIAVRAFQFDFIHTTEVRIARAPAISAPADHFRVQSGIVFKLNH